MTMFAPVFFFYYIQGPLYSILQATGDAKAGMMNSVYGGIAKLAVMFILASQPGLQETGAVLAIGFGVLNYIISSYRNTSEKQSHRHRFYNVCTCHMLFHHDSDYATDFHSHRRIWRYSRNVVITITVFTGDFILTGQVQMNDFMLFKKFLKEVVIEIPLLIDIRS